MDVVEDGDLAFYGDGYYFQDNKQNIINIY